MNEKILVLIVMSMLSTVASIIILIACIIKDVIDVYSMILTAALFLLTGMCWGIIIEKIIPS